MLQKQRDYLAQRTQSGGAKGGGLTANLANWANFLGERWAWSLVGVSPLGGSSATALAVLEMGLSEASLKLRESFRLKPVLWLGWEGEIESFQGLTHQGNQ